jgi:phosphate transport system permease protein
LSQSGSRDAVLAVVSRASAAIAGGLFVLIAGFLILRAQPAFAELGLVRFVADSSWHPTPGTEGEFSLVPAMVGSVITTALATLIAVPIGAGAALGAVYFVRPSIGRTLNVLVGVLAGLPSVVIGLWGLTTLVPWIARIRAPGTSVLAAALTLAAMIVPTVYVTASSALNAVPRSELDAAAAMGLSRWGTIRAVVVPMMRPAIVLAALLAIARALGETMAVVMVAGNVAAVPSSVLDPVRTLTANIALELAYATGLHRAALFASGAALLLLVWVLVVGAGRLSGASRGGRSV